MLSLSMLRFRRRSLVFLVFAAALTILVIRFSQATDWEHTEHPDVYSKDGHEQTSIKAPPPEVKKSSDTPKNPAPPVEEEHIITNPATIPPAVVSDEVIPPTKVVQDNENAESRIRPVAPPSRQDLPTFDNVPTVIHWEKQVEHFPVPTESIIKLPTGFPSPIPRIQYDFHDETPDAKITRQDRLSKVKEEFKKSWTGYKSRAWLHDELTPVSGKFRDPFCGWAATLVDSLDTIWIMGLEEEFEEAVKAVDGIDFTTSQRQEIPLFETTIRYLGGLLGAYDVSGKKYPTLLKKAEELAEILIGAFDTPNRMPILFYNWKPAFASQPHRARQNSNLAELGSLSLEFTRLAQLTKDPRYYDAVARVTIALAEFQDRTKLPGVFPPAVDTSGCNRTVPIVPEILPAEQPKGYTPNTPKSATEPAKGRIVGWDGEMESGISKRGLEEVEGSVVLNKRAPQTNPVSGLPLDLPNAKAELGNKLDGWDCIPQNLTSSQSLAADRFSMGGNQDSTYEYFSKQYLLLGGREDTYRQMYLKTIETIRKSMLFRPMIPGTRDVLFAGSLTTDGMPDTNPVFGAEVEHLTCFIGGMVGMAAQIFNIEGDLEIAKKLVDGCVWAYESMGSGIMAESAVVMPCSSPSHCTWNETAYYETIDPTGDQKDQILEKYLVDKATRDAAKEAAKMAAAQVKLGKTNATAAGNSSEPTPNPTADDDRPEPPRPPSHREFVEAQIERFSLPPGYVSINSKSYILRPEAIESVWYMYRITGDASWQEKGWKMFEAVINATSAEYGHSAIEDVTLVKPKLMDQMESFWLAETLKYFYLLFSTPDTISLDEWVLNTEAHPFRREA